MSTDDASRPVSLREISVVTLGLALLTAALTYPQVARLGTDVAPHVDAEFGVWRLAWIAHQVAADPAHLFDANIFHPELNTLAYSDAVLLLRLIAAPPIWAGLHPVTVYNLMVLISFVAAGLGMYALVRGIGCAAPAAAIAAAGFAFQPYRFAHFAQLELLWTCWIPLAFLALHRAMAQRTWRSGMWLGLCVALQALSCLYYAVFTITALAVLAPLLAAWTRDRRRLWRPALAAIVVTGILVGPYVSHYQRGQDVVGLRTWPDVQRWSAGAGSYTAAQKGSWLYPDLSPTVDTLEGVLFPGLVTLVCALVGAIAGPRRLALAYGALALVGFDLSLGANGLLYRYLFETVWVYQGLRVPARGFVIVSAALGPLVAFGAMRVVAPWRSAVVAAAIIAAITVESVSIPLELQSLPRVPPRLHTLLAGLPRGAVLEWPVPAPSNLGATRDQRYMYLSTFHWQPLANGYSGHHPEAYVRLLHELMDFPSANSVAAMRRHGIRYVVLHSEPDPGRFRAAKLALAAIDAVDLYSEEAGANEDLALFVLEPAAAAGAIGGH